MRKRILLLVAVLLFLNAYAYKTTIYKIETYPDKIFYGDSAVLNVLIKNADSTKEITDLIVEVNSSDAFIYPKNVTIWKIEPLGVSEARFTVIANKSKDFIDVNISLIKNDKIIESRTFFIPMKKKDVLLNYNKINVEAGNCSKIKLFMDVFDEIDDVKISFIRNNLLNVEPNYFYFEKLTKGHHVLNLNLCADKELMAGNYQILAKIEYNKNEKMVELFQIPVKVSNKPNLIISSIKTKLKEGEDGNIYLYVDNLSPEPAFSVKLNLTKAGCKLDKSIFWADSAIYRGVASKIEINCFDAKGGIQDFEGYLSYKDRYGKKYNKKIKFEVEIPKKPVLKLSSYKVEYLRGDKLRLILFIKNKGIKEAKFVDVEADLEWPFSSSEKRDFIGDIAPNETKKAVLYLDIYPNAEEKEYGVKIKLKYRDENDQEYTEIETVSVKVKLSTRLQYAINWIKDHIIFTLLAFGLLGYIAFNALKKSQ